MGEVTKPYGKVIAALSVMASLVWLLWPSSDWRFEPEPAVSLFLASVAWIALEVSEFRERGHRPVHPIDEELAFSFLRFFDENMQEFLLGPFAPSISSHCLNKIFDTEYKWANETLKFSDYGMNYEFNGLKAKMRRLSSVLAVEYNEVRLGRAQINLPREDLATDYYSACSLQKFKNIEGLAEDFRQSCIGFFGILSKKYPELLRTHRGSQVGTEA